MWRASGVGVPVILVLVSKFQPSKKVILCRGGKESKRSENEGGKCYEREADGRNNRIARNQALIINNNYKYDHLSLKVVIFVCNF